MTPEEQAAFMEELTRQLDVIHISAIIALSLSIPCSLLIMFLTLREYLAKKKMSIVRWFPFFISLGDLFVGIFHLADHAYSYNNGNMTAQGTLCEFFAFMTHYGVFLSFSWMCAIIVFVFLMLIDRVPNFGCYSYKLLLICFVPPFIYSVIPFAFDGYNSSGAFCYTFIPNNDKWELFDVGILLFLLPTFIIIMTLLCLYQLFFSSTNHRGKPQTNLAIGLIAMALFFALQYIPFAVVVSLTVANVAVDYRVNAFVLFLANFGGVYNLSVYLIVYRQKNVDTSKEDLNIILNDTQLSKNFLDYAKSKHSEENVMFLLEVMSLKDCSFENLEKLNNILKKYVIHGSEFEINVSHKSYKQATERINELTRTNNESKTSIAVTDEDCRSAIEGCDTEIRQLVRNDIKGFLKNGENLKLMKLRKQYIENLSGFGLKTTSSSADELIT